MFETKVIETLRIDDSVEKEQVAKLVERKSKRGKIFYGCSEYPKCDAVYWDKPILEPCPQCAAPFLLEKTTKKGTTKSCRPLV